MIQNYAYFVRNFSHSFYFMSVFHAARFFKTVAHLKDLPPSSAEIAFVGRSNAGKSTVINTLCRQRRLAHVSKMPGRTQNLNYFSLPLKEGESHFLVDLPGYGYANAPEEIRKSWDRLISPYLEKRAVLKGVVSVMDCRHPFTSLDCALLTWYRPKGWVRILLNKADKLNHHQQTEALREAQKMLTLLIPEQHRVAYSVQLFSALNKKGLPELSDYLSQILKNEF